MEKVIKNLIRVFGEVTVKKHSTLENVIEVVYNCTIFCMSDNLIILNTPYTIMVKDGKMEVTLLFENNETNN
jgi:hypothetical protein